MHDIGSEGVYSSTSMKTFISVLFVFFFAFGLGGRSNKEKHSSYAPDRGLRYDGIYRIEECWRKNGTQVRCS